MIGLRSAVNSQSQIVGNWIQTLVIGGAYIERAYLYLTSELSFEDVVLSRRSLLQSGDGDGGPADWNARVVAGLLDRPLLQVEQRGIAASFVNEALRDWLLRAKRDGLIEQFNRERIGHPDSMYIGSALISFTFVAYRFYQWLRREMYVLPLKDGRIAMVCGIRHEHVSGERRAQLLLSTPAAAEAWLDLPDFVQSYNPDHVSLWQVKPNPCGVSGV
jgi:hypothetical protein